CADAFEEILDYVDTVILDIKAIDGDKYKKLTSQKIDKFENFLEVCQQKKKKLWIRQVIIPGFNDTEEDILKLKEYISKIKNVKKVELLPYHDMAKDKYKKLGMKYKLENTPAMDKVKCQKLQKLLLKK
ncbi:MAG: pyruvate formate-lyase 1-activating enzyme, partial [Clostridia bacterium]|nr:pyruvate formate-lyase 1-activating enzyme [Clostridia bacterium]